MENEINRVFMGDTRDFYGDDFPTASFGNDAAELTAALGDKLQVER